PLPGHSPRGNAPALRPRRAIGESYSHRPSCCRRLVRRRDDSNRVSTVCEGHSWILTGTKRGDHIAPLSDVTNDPDRRRISGTTREHRLVGRARHTLEVPPGDLGLTELHRASISAKDED